MSDKDPIVAALLFSSQMTLDLVWALQWLSAVDFPQSDSFDNELAERRKRNPALDSAAKEAGL